ncbi:MAG: RNA polymerase sigma factor, partial [Planctomycetota bacterium]
MKNPPLDSTDLTWLAGLARALLGESHAADDLVQETALAAIGGAMPEGAPRRAWLAGVARRLAARRFRGEARRARREEAVARSEALPDSTEIVAKAEIAEQVTAAARRLDEPFRRTTLLRFLEGLSPEEIARREGKPVDTVRWRVRRGLELLREELVREHDRDWSSWCVLLLPLARIKGSAGLATAGATGVVPGTVASITLMKITLVAAVVLLSTGLWFTWKSGERVLDEPHFAMDTRDVELARPATLLEGEEVADLVTPIERQAVAAEETFAKPVVTERAPQDLFGRVVDEDGEGIADATIFLIPAQEEA